MKKQIFIIILIILLPFILFAQSKMSIDQSSYQMIQYSVSVVGNVVNPGTYTLSPIKRISDAIQTANSAPIDSVTVEIRELLNNSSSRNITIKRKNESIHVDLERFLRYGDDKHNPYIQDGDIIIVPAIEQKVTISGSVNRGGEFELVKNDRIMDIVMLSMGLSDNAYLNKAEVVRFINQSDSTEIIEVNLFEILNNPSSEENLFLENDDRIFIKSIPEYHKRKRLGVSVFGAVINGGEFDLTEGYRLYDAIAVAGGLRDDAYLDKAEVVRFINDSDSTKIININLYKVIENPEFPDNLLLENDDRIFIKSIPEYHRQFNISIMGEVKFPGTYAIIDQKTTLRDVLIEAGGPTQKADLLNAYLQRRSREDVVDPEFERLKLMLVEDMTPLEYEYFKTKSRELRGKFATNFPKLWLENDPEFNFLLKTGDYIYIPDKTVTVTISGQVKNPGLVTFVEGKNYLYYINKAGGFAWRARKGKIRLIKANTGEWLKPNENTPVEVGDMVFIPEKPEIDYWDLTKDIMTIAAQIATVIIVIQNTVK